MSLPVVISSPRRTRELQVVAAVAAAVCRQAGKRSTMPRAVLTTSIALPTVRVIISCHYGLHCTATQWEKPAVLSLGGMGGSSESDDPVYGSITPHDDECYEDPDGPEDIYGDLPPPAPAMLPVRNVRSSAASNS